jgi:hypothetical protein
MSRKTLLTSLPIENQSQRYEAESKAGRIGTRCPYPRMTNMAECHYTIFYITSEVKTAISRPRDAIVLTRDFRARQDRHATETLFRFRPWSLDACRMSESPGWAP